MNIPRAALSRPHVVLNPSARRDRGTANPADSYNWHRQQPGYSPTPLIQLAHTAKDLHLESLWVKAETQRFGLPAFKILGASWAAEACISREALVQTLVTATDGNHGRAVARVARSRDLHAEVFVPRGTTPTRISAIEAEGAHVRIVDGSYDDAVVEASRFADSSSEAILLSDTSDSPTDRVGLAIIDGYSTIFSEVQEQLRAAGAPFPDLVVVQVGVGGLCAAAVRHVTSRTHLGTSVVSVEPVTAACAFASIAAGRSVTTTLPHTSSMVGLNASRLSATAWPTVAIGVDCAVAIEDDWCDLALSRLANEGVESGETGAAGLAGLEALLSEASGSHDLGRIVDVAKSALVVVTEGRTS